MARESIHELFFVPHDQSLGDAHDCMCVGVFLFRKILDHDDFASFFHLRMDPVHVRRVEISSTETLRRHDRKLALASLFLRSFSCVSVELQLHIADVSVRYDVGRESLSRGRLLAAMLRRRAHEERCGRFALLRALSYRGTRLLRLLDLSK